MSIHESSENYLETILVLSNRLPAVRSIDVATELDFKKSSVSVAMKNLRENGYITVTEAGYIFLTDSGKGNCRYDFRKTQSSFYMVRISWS